VSYVARGNKFAGRWAVLEHHREQVLAEQVLGDEREDGQNSDHEKTKARQLMTVELLEIPIV
jgi:hypothetical protein